jgi:hypothetical protein
MTEDDGWAENPMPEWEWWNTQGWSLNMNERKIPAIGEDGSVLDDPQAEEEFRDWSWLRVGKREAILMLAGLHDALYRKQLF